MRTIAVTVMLAALAGCGTIGNPIHNPIHGPATSDCRGTHTRLAHHVIGERDHIGLVTGLVIYQCDRVPVLFRLVITIQNRRPGKVAWHDIASSKPAEFDEKLGLDPVIGHPYLLTVRFECHGPYTRYWRLRQVYSGDARLSDGKVVPVPPVTVYFPYPDPLEQGIKFRCGT